MGGAQARISSQGLDEQGLVLISANVLRSNRDFSAVRQAIASANPDCFGLIELDQAWADAFEELDERYSYTLLDPHDEDGYGMGLYCQGSLVRSSRVIRLGDDLPPMIEASLETSDGQVFDLILVHTYSPASLEDWRRRDRQLELLAEEVSRRERPVVIMGDLNTTMWSQGYQELVSRGSLLDPRVGQGIVPTWTLLPEIAFLPLLPLDHALLSPVLGTVEVDRLFLPGSDHWAVVLKMNA